MYLYILNAHLRIHIRVPAVQMRDYHIEITYIFSISVHGTGLRCFVEFRIVNVFFVTN